MGEVGASQAGKPEEDTLVNSSHSSERLSHKEFFETSEDQKSEDIEEHSFKSSHLTPSSACSKGERIRHKEERRERNRQKRGERKVAVRATNLNESPITIERTKGGALAEKEKPPLPRTRGGALEDDPNICKVCRRSFQRLLKHLASSADCAQEYDLQKMHEENKAKSAAKRVENQSNKRKAERAEDEPAFKAKRAAGQQHVREALRAQNEEEFKAKRAAEMRITRDALRSQNEEEFKAKRAA